MTESSNQLSHGCVGPTYLCYKSFFLVNLEQNAFVNLTNRILFQAKTFDRSVPLSPALSGVEGVDVLPPLESPQHGRHAINKFLHHESQMCSVFCFL